VPRRRRLHAMPAARAVLTRHYSCITICTRVYL
jgi:hypothetical protein